MADSEPSTTVILHVNLGDASKYDKNIFPREYHNAGNALSKGSVLLSSTLDEMQKIIEMGIDLKNDSRFKRDTQLEFHRLATIEERLKSRPKSFNPFVVFRSYRAERIFLSASKAFYRETKETSEKIQREKALMQIVSSKELTTINDDVPPNAMIGGIAVHGQDAEQTVLAAINAMVSRYESRTKDPDPFIDDPQIPQYRDDDSIITLADTASLLSQVTPSSSHSPQTEPMSPGSTFHLHLHNSVLAAGGNVHGVTLNQGDGNRGSHMTQVTQQSDP